MGRKSLKDQRQKEIIIAFYIVSVKEGLENASIAKVAKEMDINPSLIIHYFKSKDALVLGLINYILDRYKSFFAVYDTNINPEQKLVNIINHLFSRDWNSYINDGVFYSCYSLIFRNEEIKLAFKDVHDFLRCELVKVLSDAKKNDVIDTENLKEIADLIFSLVEGSYYYLSFFDNNEELNKKIDIYRNITFEMLKLNQINDS